jgi:hypothetical protein
LDLRDGFPCLIDEKRPSLPPRRSFEQLLEIEEVLNNDPFMFGLQVPWDGKKLLSFTRQQ